MAWASNNWRTIVLIGAGSIVVIIAAVLIAPSLINWNSFKPQIASAVREATGKELRIDGDVTLSLLPKLTLSVSGVHLLDPATGPSAEILSVAEIAATARVWPLLSRRLVVDQLVIREPMLSLAVDRDGHANWVDARPDTKPPETGDAGGNELIRDILLADVRIDGGQVTYEDLRTGRSLQANDIIVTAALPEPGNPASLAGRLLLNNEPTTVAVSGEAPGGVLRGERFGLEASLESRLLNARYTGNFRNRPAAAADGDFEIDIGSLAGLVDWLGMPVPRLRSDPGPMMLSARFAADSDVFELQDLVIRGDGVDARASGRIDHGAAVPALLLDVETGLVDVDHYLTLAQTGPSAPAVQAEAPAAAPDIFAALSDAPFDLSGLRGADAEVRVQLGGVRAAGFEVGPIDMAVGLTSGVATADIAEIGVYGGVLRGRVALNAADDALALKTDLSFDGVVVDDLARAALGEAPLSGVAAGTLSATASGVSARALVAGAVGKMTLGLNDPVVPAAPGTLADVMLTIDLPGPTGQPRIAGDVIYNGEPTNLVLSFDPLDQIFDRDNFTVAASVSSRVAKASFDGRVMLRPGLGAGGTIVADVTSVDDIGAWLGLPLDGLAEDPGPVALGAQFALDMSALTVTLDEVTVESAFADARGSGRFDVSGPTPKVSLDLVSNSIDLGRLLPSTAVVDQGGTPPAPTDTAEGGERAALPDTPLDLTGLQAVDADVRVRIGQLSVPAMAARPIDVSLGLDAGVATVTITELGLAGGVLSGGGTLDGASAMPALSAALTFGGIEVGALMREAPLSGVGNGTLDLSAQGVSVRALVANLTGALTMTLDQVDVRDARLGTVADLSLTVDLPGPAARPQLDGNVTYNGEPTSLALTLDPLDQILSSDRLEIVATAGSRLVSARYDGAVLLAPSLGVDGDLDVDIGSVADLSKWLGRPLTTLPSDPGPLTVSARFAADAGAMTLDLEKLTVAGEGLEARVSGGVDASGTVPKITLDVQGGVIDLDRFLPQRPAEEPTSQTTPPATEKEEVSALPDGGWSKAQLDLTGLRRIEGEVRVEIGSLRFGELDFRDGVVNVVLRDGVLTGDIDSLQVADGVMSGTATLDASDDIAALRYEAAAQDIAARPVLRSFGTTDRLSGTATLAAQGTARGRSQQELVASLDGHGEFRVADGAIHGINVPATLRRVRTLGFEASAGEAQRTDFAEMAGSFEIKDGVVDNRDFKLLAPLLRLTGEGLVALPPQTVDYQIEAKLVASLEGQSGRDALAGLPIPVNIAGPWTQPRYGVDWQNVFQAMAQDPERLTNLPTDLRQLGASLGVALPNPGSAGGGLENVLGAITGSSEAATDPAATPTAAGDGARGPEGAVTLFQQLIAPGGVASPADGSEPPPSADAPAAPAPDPVGVLRGLFGK